MAWLLSQALAYSVMIFADGQMSSIWVTDTPMALPFPHQTHTYSYLTDVPGGFKVPLCLSLMCTLLLSLWSTNSRREFVPLSLSDGQAPFLKCCSSQKRYPAKPRLKLFSPKKTGGSQCRQYWTLGSPPPQTDYVSKSCPSSHLMSGSCHHGTWDLPLAQHSPRAPQGWKEGVCL